MKFKKGDRVIVNNVQSNHGFAVGEEVVIVELFRDANTPHYKAEGKYNYGYLGDTHIKGLVVPELKAGMVVEQANGNRKLVVELGGKMGLVAQDVYGMLDMYRQDLTNKDFSKFDIVKVFQPKHFESFERLLNTEDLIWERKEVSEEVQLNEEYTATVKEDKITVGCQTFSFESFDKLSKVVATIREA